MFSLSDYDRLAMMLSAELRYFWKAVPAALEEWYHRAAYPPGGGGMRTDEYLLDTAQTELGIKRRGEKPGVEVKGLVKLGAKAAVAPFTGQIEIWCKWTSPALLLDAGKTIAILKQRWLRKFDTLSGSEIPLGPDELPLGGLPLPQEGCNVELTKLTLPDGAVWWSCGLEAFGPPDHVEKNLTTTSALLGAPQFTAEMVASYPVWLKTVAANDRR
jgi:hypothetical protein